MSDTIAVPFGEWTPDLPELQSTATEAKGVIAAGPAYIPIPDVEVIATAEATARVQGAKSFYDASGDVQFLCGDATKLYQLESGALTDRSGATYTTGSDAIWEFAQYGQKVVATNYTDVLQVFNMDSPGNFSNLAGSPPKGRQIGRIRDFLVVGDIPSYPSRVQWSAFSDITDWTIDGVNQADLQDLTEDGGAVKGIFNVFETGFIFQERNITRMTYVGLPEIFTFDVVESQSGSIVGAHGMVQHQSMIFFPFEDGFYVWNGNSSEKISDNKVSRYFLNNLNYGYRHNIFGAFDYKNHAVWWAYPSGSSQTPTDLIIFSLKSNRWTHDEGLTLEGLFNIPKRGLTLEELDAISASVDALPASLDSAIWASSSVRIGTFSTSHQLGEFIGSNREAILETQETQPSPGRRVFVSEIWPIVDDGASLTVVAQVATRAQLPGDTLTYSPASARNATGFCPVRASGRYARAKLVIPAGLDWNHAEGVQVRFRQEGRR